MGGGGFLTGSVVMNRGWHSPSTARDLAGAAGPRQDLTWWWSVWTMDLHQLVSTSAQRGVTDAELHQLTLSTGNAQQ